MQQCELSNVESVLRVLTALIAPALLVSACGTFILSTSNRLSLTTERVRRLAIQMRRVEDMKSTPSRDDLGRRLWLELQLTYQRVMLQHYALRLFYAATVLFVGCSLSLGLEAVIVVLPLWLPVALGLVGVAVLLAACALLVLDVRRLIRGMKLEMEDIRRRVRHVAPLG